MVCREWFQHPNGALPAYEWDFGAAIGAFHQTGWTGLIADVILRRHGAVPALGDVLRDLQERRGPDH